MITRDRLKKLLYYNAKSGAFKWKVYRRNSRGVGGITGCINKNSGYMILKLDGVNYPAHRIAWLYMYGEFPKEQIDHINHDRLDNRIENLRDVCSSINSKNMTIFSNNTSGITGVCLNKRANKWIAFITINSTFIHLGRFKDKKDAIAIRLDAENKHGFHKNHGKT